MELACLGIPAQSFTDFRNVLEDSSNPPLCSSLAVAGSPLFQFKYPETEGRRERLSLAMQKSPSAPGTGDTEQA